MENCITMTATPETLAAAARWRAAAKEVQQTIYEEEVAAVESRKGELPKRDLTELRLLHEQIGAARTERETTKETLVATRTTEQVTKDTLQAQLAAATKAAERQTIRAQIDTCNAKLEQARLGLELADQMLESLQQAREEILFQERLAKDELLAEDAAKVQARKDRQAAECDDIRAWLAKRGIS
jgi:cysteinyl-tRNA synthetase